MRDINDLNVIGTTGSNRRVETKDEGQTNQEVLVRYPRNVGDTPLEERARFASLAIKGLAHLGFSSAGLSKFGQELFATAEKAEAAKTAEAEAPCEPKSVVIDGVTYVAQA